MAILRAWAHTAAVTCIAIAACTPLQPTTSPSIGPQLGQSTAPGPSNPGAPPDAIGTGIMSGGLLSTRAIGPTAPAPTTTTEQPMPAPEEPEPAGPPDAGPPGVFSPPPPPPE